QRLRVVAGGDLDLVAPLAQELDQRPEDQHVRRRRHVHPDLQAVTPTTRRSIASAARSPACPSQSGGICPRFGSVSRAGTSRKRSGSSPSSVFVPSSIVTGRSVFLRSVKQG